MKFLNFQKGFPYSNFCRHLVAILLIVCTQGCVILQPPKKNNLPKKEILVSFDDGPNGHDNVTNRVLDVLSKHAIKGYFCLIGINAKKHPEIIRRIHEEGHTMVNHGYTDKIILFKSRKNIEKDIVAFNTLMQSLLENNQAISTYYRPPCGWFRPSLHTLLKKYHMKLLPLNFYALDAHRNHQKTSKVISETVEYIKKHEGGIIVLHDGKNNEEKMLKEIAENPATSYNRTWVPEVLDTIITILKNDGYTFQ